MASDGSAVTQLTDSSTDNVFPEFSPDGYQILFCALDSSVDPAFFELRFVLSDGSKERVLGPGAGWTSWAPDGQTIALVTSWEAGNLDVGTVSHGKLTRLTTDPAADQEPDWSPDGTTIAFTRYRYGVPHIYLMDASGQHQRRLTTGNYAELEPDWSPDGKKIALMVWVDDTNTQVFIVDADGTNLRQVTDSPGFNENPAWSPDGTMLAFWSDRTGNREIFLVKPDGSQLTQLTNNPSADENPSWSPILVASAPALTPSAPSRMELSGLSGEWTGIETLTSIGQCKLAGGSDSVSNPVKMMWTVSDEGDIAITLPEWPGVYPYTFTGKAQPDLSVSLELSTGAMCEGNAHQYAAHYANTIQVKGDTLTLEMEATEVWCPTVCIFRRKYSIQKSVTLP